MTTNIEDRLVAALAARAETVQPEDLRPADPPTSRRPPVRPSTWLLAAAAAVAVVGILAATSVLGGDDGEVEPAPVVPASPTPAGDDVQGGDWRVAYEYPRAYDVDGDGTADPVVIRTKGDRELPRGVRRFEVHLSTGGVAALLLDYDAFDMTAIEPVEVGGDGGDGGGGDEILYDRGTVDSGAELGVLDLVDGALVDVEVARDPGLTSDPDADFHDRGWFVDDGGLYSWRTVEGGFVPGGTNPAPPPYPVDLFRWSLVDGELTADPVGSRCWNGGNGPSGMEPC